MVRRMVLRRTRIQHEAIAGIRLSWAHCYEVRYIWNQFEKMIDLNKTMVE